jgi:hypothetical protein
LLGTAIGLEDDVAWSGVGLASGDGHDFAVHFADDLHWWVHVAIIYLLTALLDSGREGSNEIMREILMSIIADLPPN